LFQARDEQDGGKQYRSDKQDTSVLLPCMVKAQQCSQILDGEQVFQTMAVKTSMSRQGDTPAVGRRSRSYGNFFWAEARANTPLSCKRRNESRQLSKRRNDMTTD
jgi:hypothetical protein